MINNHNLSGKLIFKNGPVFKGKSFGADIPASGELVFATGMTGYPQSFTDPSFAGQILTLTYPIIGSYGIPDQEFWESRRPWINGLIVADYIDTPSHYQNKMTLSFFLKKFKIPALIIKDTRFIAQYLRNNGSTLGKIIFTKDIPFYNPNLDNLIKMVSVKNVIKKGEGKKNIILIDCGEKRNMEKCLLNRGVSVTTIPWNFDLFKDQALKFDGIIIANGPGDPKMANKTIDTVKQALLKKIPLLGICLGHQILALAAGGDTYKLKFGHRSQNQPCLLENTKRCYITTQNHGFAVNKIPSGFKSWFINANDNSNEGIIHEKLPFMSVQFHPEANPGPTDTEWIFDYFLKHV